MKIIILISLFLVSVLMNSCTNLAEIINRHDPNFKYPTLEATQVAPINKPDLEFVISQSAIGDAFKQIFRKGLEFPLSTDPEKGFSKDFCKFDKLVDYSITNKNTLRIETKGFISFRRKLFRKKVAVDKLVLELQPVVIKKKDKFYLQWNMACTEIELKGVMLSFNIYIANKLTESLQKAPNKSELKPLSTEIDRLGFTKDKTEEVSVPFKKVAIIINSNEFKVMAKI